jgi:hypothetical protein
MSMTLLPLSASILVFGGGGGPVTERGLILSLLAAGAIILGAACWGAVEEWIDYNHGRRWPAVSAVIDDVSVTVVEPKGISSTANHYWPTFLATLTYTYHNPEQHSGHYKRSFASEDDAKSWANSYKDESVTVHVDPRDPTRSLLRDKDL